MGGYLEQEPKALCLGSLKGYVPAVGSRGPSVLEAEGCNTSRRSAVGVAPRLVLRCGDR